MIKIKSTVRPRALVLLAAAANAATDLQLSVDLVVTSGNDSKHMKGSKHYDGDAIDLRSKTFPSATAKRLFLEAVRARLGDDYEIFLEGEGTPNEHFHLEYDPPWRLPRGIPV